MGPLFASHASTSIIKKSSVRCRARVGIGRDAVVAAIIVAMGGVDTTGRDVNDEEPCGRLGGSESAGVDVTTRSPAAGTDALVFGIIIGMPTEIGVQPTPVHAIGRNDTPPPHVIGVPLLIIGIDGPAIGVVVDAEENSDEAFPCGEAADCHTGEDVMVIGGRFQSPDGGGGDTNETKGDVTSGVGVGGGGMSGGNGRNVGTNALDVAGNGGGNDVGTDVGVGVTVRYACPPPVVDG